MDSSNSSQALPKINSYQLTSPQGPEIVARALVWLRPHLPVSIPTYRRLQFRRFFPATLLLTNLDLDNDDSPNWGKQHDLGNDEGAMREPWFITFIDRSCRPETEVYFFGSWETSWTNGTAKTSSSPAPPQQSSKFDILMHSLLHTLKSLPLPESIHATTLDPTTNDSTNNVGFSRIDYGGHISNPEIMLWGGLHEANLPSLQRLGVVSTAHQVSMVPNWTFVWDVEVLARERGRQVKGNEKEGSSDVSVEEDRLLPPELRWGELQREHLALVRSRTQIPRQERTLAILPNVAIFPRANKGEEGETAAPVAWAFVGLDASLTSLHVEPELRGRGLAKAVTTKIFTERMGLFWEKGLTKWAHGYVTVGNKESEGMCRSLGGKSGYESFWVRVDLGKVQ